MDRIGIYSLLSMNQVENLVCNPTVVRRVPSGGLNYDELIVYDKVNKYERFTPPSTIAL